MMSALFAVAVATQAQTPQLTRIDWIRRPTSADVADVFPLGPQRLGVSGKAQMACQVAPDGRLLDCKTVSEEPAGFGFGDAALRLAKYFQIRPGSAPGRPDGAHVNIPVLFTIAHGETRWVTELEYPAWTSAPTFAEVAGAYPAKGGGVVGLVTLRCPLGSDGAVKSRCDIVDEAPKYDGFAQSARGLAPLFRIDPTSDVLKRGKPLWIKLRFKLEPADSDDMRLRRVSGPRWVAAPTASDIGQAYPAQAAAQGVSQGEE